MNERESDPTGAFRSGSAGLETDEPTTEFERHAPDPQRGDGRPTDDQPATDSRRGNGQTPDVDETERDVITSGTAATSEVGDPAAQRKAEGQGDGTLRPR